MVTPMNVADPADDVLTDAGMFIDLQKVILVSDRWRILEPDKTMIDCKWHQVYIRPCRHVRKSNLNIDHLIGKNLNAALIHFVTRIAYLLIALFRIVHNSLLSLLEIKRLLRNCADQPLKEVAELSPMLCTE